MTEANPAYTGDPAPAPGNFSPFAEPMRQFNAAVGALTAATYAVGDLGDVVSYIGAGLEAGRQTAAASAVFMIGAELARIRAAALVGIPVEMRP